jgi:hypothetical protein
MSLRAKTRRQLSTVSLACTQSQTWVDAWLQRYNSMNVAHNLCVSSRRVGAMQVRHELIEAGTQRCDAAIVQLQLINEMLTPTVRMHAAGYCHGHGRPIAVAVLLLHRQHIIGRG